MSIYVYQAGLPRGADQGPFQQLPEAIDDSVGAGRPITLLLGVCRV